MKITLNTEQQQALLAWAGENTAAEVEAGCEPSGYSLVIGISGPFGCSVEAVFGSRRLDLGEVEVELSPVPEAEPTDPMLESDSVRMQIDAFTRRESQQ